MRKIPFIPQFQQAECGLCTIAMLLNYYGANYTLFDIRQQIGVGRDGISIKCLIELLCEFGLKAEAYKCSDIGALRLANVPFIVTTEKEHFIIVEKVTDSNIYVVDPAIGRLRYGYDDFLKIFDGIIITVWCTEQFRKVKRDYRVWKTFLPIVMGNKKRYVKIVGMTLSIYFIMLEISVQIKNLMNDMQNGHRVYTSIMFICGFILLYILMSYLKNVELVKIKTDMDERVNEKVISRLMKLPYSFFDTRSKSDIIYTLNNISIVKDMFVTCFLNGLLDLGSIIIILGYFFISNAEFTLLVCLIIIPNLLLSIFTQPLVMRNNKNMINAKGKIQGKQMEMVYSMFDIKVRASEAAVLEEWKEGYQEYLHKYKKNESYNVTLSTILFMSQTFSPFIVFTLGIILAQSGRGNLGDIIAFFPLLEILFSQIYRVFYTIQDVIRNSVFLERLGDILCSDIKAENHNSKEVRIKGELKLKDLSFRYTKRSKEILSKINLDIGRGEKIAIVGSSGSGKSTLLKLIACLYEVTRGAILFDGIDSKVIDKKTLMSQIGIVPQDAVLYNKTILENITLGNEAITLRDVEIVTQITNIYDEINRMPMKFYTVISESGMNLSGGQRQRIILSRVLIKKPKILLLDEATSSLDYINERKISDYLSKIGATRIIVAHRLSSIIDSDKIVVLDQGKIAEIGNHCTLMSMNGIYKELYCRGSDC